ncbi:GNAT family N-acetyltransferase [Solicola sp. PLA-1-18]|uniref:GNAT family N-acetyltransferase n=1 Tax=Solicola sp. PLA-1-18 TaxID=3380532 RepID=UPI003B7F3F8E
MDERRPRSADRDAPPTVRLLPMTSTQYAIFRTTAERSYAANIARSGAMGEPEARERADADFTRLLPDGLDTADQLLLTAMDGDDEVGMVWLALTDRSDGLHAFGYDLLVREDLRRRGYGRAILEAAEAECVRRGVVSVGLSVFGFNDPARSLYEQVGFEVAAIQMTKRLGPSADRDA